MSLENDSEKHTKNSFCREIVLANRYACRANGRAFYPKDQYGNEYMCSDLTLIEHDNEYFYPLTKRGKPRYHVEDGNQVYEIINGRSIYGVGTDGKQYYAINKYGNEYYPEDNTPAKLADGTPYYASTRLGKHIFPLDANGNEYYVTFIDYKHPSTIPNRYARSSSGKEIYPLRLTLDNNEEQIIINDTYAVDEDKRPFYPKDGFRNEYYKFVSPLDEHEYMSQNTLSQIVLDRYAVTNDGKYILPEVLNKYVILPNMQPVIEKQNVIGQLIREDNRASGYLTDVLNNLLKEPVIKAYKYKDIITKETKLVIPKSSEPVLNFINITNTIYHKLCFWSWLIILFIIKVFVLWKFVFKNLSEWQASRYVS